MKGVAVSGGISSHRNLFASTGRISPIERFASLWQSSEKSMGTTALPQRMKGVALHRCGHKMNSRFFYISVHEMGADGLLVSALEAGSCSKLTLCLSCTELRGHGISAEGDEKVKAAHSVVQKLGLVDGIEGTQLALQ